MARGSDLIGVDPGSDLLGELLEDPTTILVIDVAALKARSLERKRRARLPRAG